MQKLLFVLFALAVGIGILMPSGEPDGAAASAAEAKQAGLFEAAPYKETELQRQPNGHFFVTADVNGAPIRFLVDTGATTIALTEEDARSAGLEFSTDEFEHVGRTASGAARGKVVTLPKVSIEGKEVTGVDAVILDGAHVSLLGQSYLARISGVEMNGDIMVLR